MKVVLDLPDWMLEGDLRIIRNSVELVAYKETGIDSSWFIKTDRCNHCGECCMDVGPQFIYGNDEGACNFLTSEGTCNAGGVRLLACISDPNKNDYPDCPITYKLAEVPSSPR